MRTIQRGATVTTPGPDPNFASGKQDETGFWIVSDGMEAIELTGDSTAPAPLPLSDSDAPLPALQPVTTRSVDAAIQSMYVAHYRSVYRYALLSTGRPVDAEDVVADTFARALAAERSGHGPSGPSLPWLLLICRRILTDRARRRRLISWLPLGGRSSAKEPTDEGREADPGSDHEIAAREFWLWLDALARALPERQRTVLFLRYERDLTDAQIGEVLGLSASGVRSLTARAIDSLRQHPELLR